MIVRWDLMCEWNTHAEREVERREHGGGRGQWMVLEFTFLLMAWVTNPWGWCEG